MIAASPVSSRDMRVESAALSHMAF
jgi:hypothetical protein